MVQPAAAQARFNALVEQRVSRWLAEKRSGAPEPRRGGPARPVITVSREAGASAAELGRAVAARLGFVCWDQKLVRRIAEESGSDEALLREVDEHARNAVSDLIAGVLVGQGSTEGGYFDELTRVIFAIAHQGGAVIVGRGAQFILPPSDALRVRVVGLPDARAREVAMMQHLPEGEARAKMKRIDRERHRFIRHHYRRDESDPEAYDLLVNSSTLTLEGAADVVVAAYRVKFDLGFGRP